MAGQKIFEVFGEVTIDDKKMINSLNNVKNRLKIVSAAILALGVGAVKLASDFEEAGAKFERTFEGIEEQAESTAKALQDNFGLSELEAKKLLGTTGDLLKGFGATSEQALDLSNSVQELAVDLASYNNLQGGSARASEILTKAMLGEREALISLGIKISEADVQQRLFEKGQKELTGQALLLAKSQATLELAYEQTEGAQGDFARTQNSLANQMRQLKGDVTDLAVSFGQTLIPIAKDLVRGVRGLVEWFGGLSDSSKKLIVIFGGVVAAIPAIIGGVQALSAAFAFLAANPVVAVIAALGGLALAIGVVVETSRQARMDELEQELADLKEAAGLTTEELFKMDAAIREGFFLGSIEDTSSAVDSLTEALGLTRLEVIDIALTNKEIDSITREQLFSLRENAQEWANIAELSNEVARNEAMSLRNAVAQAEALEELNRLEAEREAREAERAEKETTAALYAEMTRQIEILNDKRSLGLIEEEERLKGIIELNKKWIDDLLELGIATEDLRVQNAIGRINALQAALDDLGDATDDVAEGFEEFEEVVDQVNQSISETTQRTAENVQKAWTAAFDNIMTSVNAAGSGIKDIFSEITTNQKQQLDNTEAARKEEIENSLMSEAEKAEALKALDEEVTKERKKQAREQAIANKALALFDIGVNTAVGITKALASANFILAGIIATAGAVQAGLVAGRPLPGLENGGEIQKTAGGVPFVGGEGAYNEAVLPLSDDTFARIGAGINAAASASTVTNNNVVNNTARAIRVEVNGRELFEIIDDGYQDGFLPKMSEAIG